MLDNSAYKAFQEEIGAEAAEVLDAVTAMESWVHDNDPLVQEALRRLAEALSGPEARAELANISPSMALGIGAGVGCGRSLLWLRALLDHGGPMVRRMTTPQGEPGSETARATLFNRLLYLGRLQLLRRILAPERINDLKEALKK
ncbi:MAG: hypothetical protein CVV05_00595 [Gammaproteobacteria bacterium HGW-Gammaproteobacteria-1]|jgi:hypothetical protein|nr:MAG: hypothetical protein CVV05_00595 [Gammaproteobacteria bacterium HGW-Gammaproteobacteria-1]